MKISKKNYGYIVVASAGTDLRRVPILNLQTADGKDTVIRKVPLGTRMAAESDIIENEGHRWVVVSPEFLEEEVACWADCADLRSESLFLVTALQGTALQKKPVLRPITELEKKDVILSLPLGAQVILLQNDAQNNADDAKWHLVRTDNGGIEEIGWIDDNCLVARGEGFITTALDGAALRREPNLNSQTEDARDNVILSLPPETLFIPLTAEFAVDYRNTWGYETMRSLPSGVPYVPLRTVFSIENAEQWILGRAEIGDEAEAGWINIDYLGIRIMVSQYTPADIPVQLETGKKYYIKRGSWNSPAYTDQRIQIRYSDPVPPSYVCLVARGIRYKVQINNWNSWQKEEART
jgi:hypothetical protein